MSVFADSKVHADNPPETWVVVKYAERSWGITMKDGQDLGNRDKTRREAEEDRTTGFLATLYHQETRWMAGEKIPLWRPYADVVAERQRTIERRAARNA